MLYLTHTTDKQRPVLATDGTRLKATRLSLVLYSTVNRFGASIPCTLYGYSHRYTVVEVALPDYLQAGEYTYALAADGVEVLTGVAQIGDISADVTSYDKSVNYEQYQD